MIHHATAVQEMSDHTQIGGAMHMIIWSGLVLRKTWLFRQLIWSLGRCGQSGVIYEEGGPHVCYRGPFRPGSLTHGHPVQEH